jgi:O-antigen/teichoic acid export membrane protein
VERVRALPGLIRGNAVLRNSGVLFAGNVAAGVFYLVCSLLISRQLGPEDFGRVAVFLAFAATVLGITDLGLGTTAIRLIASYLDSDHRRAVSTMRVVVALEVMTGVVVLLVGWVLVGPLAAAFGGHDLEPVVRLAVLASALGSASAFLGPVLVAHGRFVGNAMLTLVPAVARLIGLGVLASLDEVTLTSVLVLYTALTGALLVVGPLCAPRTYLTREARELDGQSFREIFSFSKWIFLTLIAAAIAGRLDYFLLARLEGPRTVGLYAAAVQLTSVLPLLVSAIGTVLLPHVSRMTSRQELERYMSRALRGGMGLALLVAPAALLGPPLISVLFGDRFVGAGGPFRVMVLTAMVMLVVAPINMVLLALHKPNWLTAVSYAQLALTVGLHAVFIPQFGAVGAALTGLVSTTLAGMVTVTLARRATRRLSVTAPV